MEITRSDLEEWKASKVTLEFLKDVDTILQELREKPRSGWKTLDEVALYNADVDGQIKALVGVNDWFEVQMEVFNED